jgi:hypothetical protein
MTCNQADRQIRAYYRKANRPSLPCDNGCRVRHMHCHAGKPTGSGGIKGRCAARHRHVTWVVRVGPKVQLPKTAAMSPKATSYHDCGNPPGWTGHLKALHIRCGKARYVFKHIRCSNSSCTKIHSGRWACHKHGAGHYSANGKCWQHRKRIRWHVYE